MTTTPGEAALYAAMAKAFAEIEGATKAAAGQVGQQKYRYADLSAVIDAIKPALIKHGLFFTQQPRLHDGGICIETVVHHDAGDSMSLGVLFVPANKNDAQAYGSALTYARRYALVTAFGVPTEDDDGNAASKAPPKKQEEPGFIADTDVVLAIQLCEALGGSQAQEICKAYKIKALSQLTKKQGASVIDRLQGKLAEKAKAETNEMGEEA